MEDLTGKQFGAYKIVDTLGQGGMATVYKAYQPGVDRYVAIKVMAQNFATDQNFVMRFEQEAKVVAKLQHPHILPLYDYGEAHGLTYIVMPMMTGGDLSDLMTARQLSPAEISKIVSQVGDALDYAHGLGVIHRDIKPTNILLDERGHCLLADFGLVKLAEEGSHKLTATGSIVGTPAYMSPEQGMGEKLDGRSDIYSFGVILYELLTGQPPYDAETPIGVIFRHINDPLPPPQELNPNLSTDIVAVLIKAMAKAPANRYATAGDLVTAFQAAMGTNPSLQPLKTTGAQPAASVSGGSRLVRLSASKKITTEPEIPAKTTEEPVPISKPQADSNKTQTLLLVVIGLLAALLVGLALMMGMFFMVEPPEGERPAIAPETTEAVAPTPPPTSQPPPPTEALSTPTELPPSPTSTSVVPPTQPPVETATAAPVVTEAPASSPPGQRTPPAPPGAPEPGDSPPQEAIDACLGANQGNACQFTDLRGVQVSGTCRVIQEQLACFPQPR